MNMQDCNPSSDKVDDDGPPQRFYNLISLWNFIRPDWMIVLTGVVLYGMIGATYPIIAALMANVNAVSMLLKSKLTRMGGDLFT